MFSKKLQQVFDLIAKTGDRLVVLDPKNEERVVVMMDLNAYEKLINRDEKKNIETEKKVEDISINNNLEELEKLTEENLTDKINHEISVWKNKNAESSAVSDYSIDSLPKKAWSIPRDVKDNAQEVE